MNSSWAGRLLRLPFRLLPGRAVVPILRGPARGLRWIVGSGAHGCWLGSYEYERALRFSALLRHADIVFDIGAHAGYYTLLASVLVGDEGAVVAFEAMPHDLAYLRRHVEMNERRNVSIVEAAVSERSRTARSGVEIVALDDLWSEWKIGPPDVLRIEVEGGEIGVLQGGRQLLADARPIVFVVTDGAEAHAACLDLLAAARYTVEVFTDSEVVCHPI